jgi:iron complex transport system ATP-binding protein
MALTLTGARVMLGGHTLLDGVSASFAPGRIAVILGPNGAGKTTLLKVAAGLIANDAAALDGQMISHLPARARARAIGYLAQDHAVHWDVTVRELVALGRVPHRAPVAAESLADQAAIDGALAQTDTADFANRRVLTLSGGERARVLLARVLAGQPGWLLADEPLASLDPAHQLDLLARLRAVAQAGTGVLLVLHDLAQAARIADDVLVLANGCVAAHDLSADTIAHRPFHRRPCRRHRHAPRRRIRPQ